MPRSTRASNVTARGTPSGPTPLFERAHRRAPFDARLMSWYGLTLVMVERNSNLGMLYCDQALRMAGPDAELLLNQARAHLALGQRDRAVRSVISRPHRGAPRPRAHRGEEQHGPRRKPVLPFLHRNNPLNRWLGKLRHKWSRRMHPVPEVSPMMLGLLPPPSSAGDPPRSE